MLCTWTDILEDIENQKQLKVEKLIKVYSDKEYNLDQIESKQERFDQGVKILNELRDLHSQQSSQLMAKFENIIVDFIENSE